MGKERERRSPGIIKIFKRKIQRTSRLPNKVLRDEINAAPGGMCFSTGSLLIPAFPRERATLHRAYRWAPGRSTAYRARFGEKEKHGLSRRDMFYNGTTYREKLTVEYKYYHNTIKASAFAIPRAKMCIPGI